MNIIIVMVEWEERVRGLTYIGGGTRERMCVCVCVGGAYPPAQ